MKYLKRLFKKKYQVKVLSSIEKFVDKHLSEHQDKGWEIAGDIRTTDFHGSVIFWIPLKRVVRQKLF